MKRVLLLIKGLGRGGAEMILSSAAAHLNRQRFRYEVAYLLPWKDSLAADLRAAGMDVNCLDGARGVGWIARLRDLIRQRDIDLVHAHSPYPAIGARLSLRGWPGKMVYTEHGVWERYRAPTYWANAATFSRNDRVFAVSDHVRRSIRYPGALRFLPLPPVETLYHGIDVSAVVSEGRRDGVREDLGIPQGAPVVVTVANFRALKGHRYLLRAAPRVLRTIPEARFVLVGQGPLLEQSQHEAARLGIESRVFFTGFREDVPRLVAAADLFVLPSRHEGLSIALLEAMALGKPAVVTDAGGLPEVVQHGKQGLVVPAKDSGALAEEIVTLLNDLPLRQRLGEAARERAGEFDIRNAVRRMEEVYEELLS
jgi:glycosyltransferase involved in cell wall biosynthesis